MLIFSATYPVPFSADCILSFSIFQMIQVIRWFHSIPFHLSGDSMCRVIFIHLSGNSILTYSIWQLHLNLFHSNCQMILYISIPFVGWFHSILFHLSGDFILFHLSGDFVLFHSIWPVILYKSIPFVGWFHSIPFRLSGDSILFLSVCQVILFDRLLCSICQVIPFYPILFVRWFHSNILFNSIC